MSIAKKGLTDKERSAAASAMGSARTPAKAAAAARNGFKSGHSLSTGRTPIALSDFECAIKSGASAGLPCSGGDALTGHHWSCPRGKAIIRRQKEGRDLLTGLKLSEASE